MGPMSIGGTFLVFRWFFEGIWLVFHASRSVAPVSRFRSKREYFQSLVD